MKATIDQTVSLAGAFSSLKKEKEKKTAEPQQLRPFFFFFFLLLVDEISRDFVDLVDVNVHPTMWY